MKRTARVLTHLPDHLDRRLLAPIGSALVMLRRREWCPVHYETGNWVHRYRDGTVVQPALGGPSAAEQDRNTKDVFLHHYRPGPGDTVLDIGAGVGGEVRTLSRLVGTTGRVFCVEAHPRAFQCLQRAVELNKLANVTTIQCAVTRTSGSVRMQDRGESHIANRLILEDHGGIEVAGETLGKIFDRFEISSVDLLKMNIEGAELGVLESSLAVLPKVRNLVVSCHDFSADQGGPEWQRTYAPVHALLVGAGYSVHSRPNDARPWIPFYVYASREE